MQFDEAYLLEWTLAWSLVEKLMSKTILFVQLSHSPKLTGKHEEPQKLWQILVIFGNIEFQLFMQLLRPAE